MERTRKYGALQSNVVNYSQDGESPSFQKNGQGRLFIAHGDIHLLKIKEVCILLYIILLAESNLELKVTRVERH